MNKFSIFSYRNSLKKGLLDFFSMSTHHFMNVIKTHLEVILLKSQTVRFATTKIHLKLLD